MITPAAPSPSLIVRSERTAPGYAALTGPAAYSESSARNTSSACPTASRACSSVGALPQLNGHPVAHLVYVGLRHGDLLIGAPDPTSQHHRYDDAVASVDDIFDVEVQILKRSDPLLNECSGTLMTAMDAAVWKIGAGVPLDFRIEQRRRLQPDQPHEQRGGR
jgi:hypothetical protein